MKCAFTCKSIAMSGAVVALFTWAYDFLVHGNLLMQLYSQTSQFWRPMPDMQGMMAYCILYHAAMGLLFAVAYAKFGAKPQGTCDASGTGCSKRTPCFGVWAGLFLALPQLMVYVWMPLPLALPASWAASELLKWTIAGVLLAKLPLLKERA